MNRTKLNKLLKVLTPDETKVDFSNFDNEIKKLKDSLKEKITVKTLEDVNVQLEKSRKMTSAQLEKLNFNPLLTAFEDLKKNLTDHSTELITTLDDKLAQLNEAVNKSKEEAGKGDESLKTEIEGLIADVATLQARKIEIPDFGKQIKGTESKLVAMIDTAKTLNSLEGEKEKEALQVQFVNFEKQIKDLKLAFQHRGGGSMNRNISIGGNSSVLSRYTDINIKAGSNVTLSYSNNDTTKNLDLTIAATGGGGGGTVRSIATTTVSSVVGEVAATDYVVLANGGVKITLPTAVSNTNLYTVKNVGTSSVLVVTTGGQTIDGQTTVIMPIQYTSVDFISDNTNWDVT